MKKYISRLKLKFPSVMIRGVLDRLKTHYSRVLGSNTNYMLGKALGLNLSHRLWVTIGSYKIKCSGQHLVSKTVSLQMQQIKVGIGSGKFFHKHFLYTILYQLTNHQDRKFTSPDIKESVFLKSSLRTLRCQDLL